MNRPKRGDFQHWVTLNSMKGTVVITDLKMAIANELGWNPSQKEIDRAKEQNEQDLIKMFKPAREVK